MSQNITPIKKISLYSFIVFLAISALVAIASVIHGDFGWFEVSLLISTSTTAGASICALCCSVYMSKHNNALPAKIGIALAGISAGMFTIGSWAEIDSWEYWQCAIIIGIFAIAFAHALALMSVTIKPSFSWLRLTTTISIFILACLFSLMVFLEAFDLIQVIAVLSIVVTLETLVIPILGKLSNEHLQTKEILTLNKREDGFFEDSNGRIFEVNEITETESV